MRAPRFLAADSEGANPGEAEPSSFLLREFPGRLRPWDVHPPDAEILAFDRRLMAIHAHPDDEASKGSGTVPYYVAQGIRASLVCCTGGEAGDILNEAMNHPEVRADLANVRMRELAESVDHNEYAVAYMLGYRDSGMPDSHHNEHDEAFAQSPDREALARLVAIVRAERPHVILGYDEHKMYPHPDHVKAHEITMAVWDAAADPDFSCEGIALGPPWEVQRLYWFHWSVARMKVMAEEMRRLGWESPFSKWADSRDNLDERVTTRVDVGAYLERRRLSLLAHRTQIDPSSHWLRISDERVRELYPWEDYVLIRDRAGREIVELETDLFDGI